MTNIFVWNIGLLLIPLFKFFLSQNIEIQKFLYNED